MVLRYPEAKRKPIINHNPQSCNKQKAKAPYPYQNLTFTFSTLPNTINRKRESPTLIRTSPSVGFMDSCVNVNMNNPAIY